MRYRHSSPVIICTSSAVVTNYHGIDHRLITKVVKFQEKKKIRFPLLFLSCPFFNWVLDCCSARWIQAVLSKGTVSHFPREGRERGQGPTHRLKPKFPKELAILKGQY